MLHPAFRLFWSVSLLIAVLTLCLLQGSPALASAEKFPVFPCIQDNVRFWEAIYSRYTTHQGVVHDSENLRRVYGVISLQDSRIPGAGAVNSARKDEAKQHVQAVLERLASGHAPRTVEERRIAALFPTRRAAAYREAAGRLRVQVGQSDRFHAGVLRSGRYLPQFRHIFASKGLPPELAYLPHVESSFNPKAYSKAGASGLWQFTPGTGKEFMMINDLVDERRDPYRSAVAAAELLEENYRQLGDWPLALTAYNHGRQGMKRALKARGSYEKIFLTYNEGSFKFASRNFYSEFLAAMRVAQRLERNPHIIREAPEWTTSFRLRQAAPLHRVRAETGLSQSEFLRLNPALLAPVTSGTKPVPAGYRVRTLAKKRPENVTPARAAIVAPRPNGQQQLAPPRKPGKQTPSRVARPASPADSTIAFRTYTLKKGETITTVARKFNVLPREILAANPGRDSRLPRAGDTIRIPASR
ncbi:MAG: transglycosylase SLT domain-containing protein [Desulfobulbus sp.]|jgi:membrane-bound lytic murein transglycosylase D